MLEITNKFMKNITLTIEIYNLDKTILLQQIVCEVKEYRKLVQLFVDTTDVVSIIIANQEFVSILQLFEQKIDEISYKVLVQDTVEDFQHIEDLKIESDFPFPVQLLNKFEFNLIQFQKKWFSSNFVLFALMNQNLVQLVNFSNSSQKIDFQFEFRDCEDLKELNDSFAKEKTVLLLKNDQKSTKKYNLSLSFQFSEQKTKQNEFQPEIFTQKVEKVEKEPQKTEIQPIFQIQNDFFDVEQQKKKKTKSAKPKSHLKKEILDTEIQNFDVETQKEVQKPPRRRESDLVTLPPLKIEDLERKTESAAVYVSKAELEYRQQMKQRIQQKNIQLNIQKSLGSYIKSSNSDIYKTGKK